MGVLVCLARHAPETATRDKIFEEVWAGSVVQDEVLSRNISILRSYLDSDDVKHIQTVPRVGYRLLEPVGPLTGSPANQSRWQIRAAIGIGVIVLAIWLLTAIDNEPVAEPGDSFSLADYSGRGKPPFDVNSALRSTRLSAQLLLLGNSNVERRGAEFLHSSIALFEDALNTDAGLAEAHLGLANAYALLPSYEPSDSEKMFAYALTELQVYVNKGGNRGRTYATEAFIHLQRMAWVEAGERFRLAIEHNPRDGNTRQWYSQLLSRVGHIAAAGEQAGIALDLDPKSPVANHRLGVAYVWAGDNEKAERQFAAAQQTGIAPFVNPEARLILYIRQGKLDQTVDLLAAIQQSQRFSTGWVERVGIAFREPEMESRRLALDALQQAWEAGEVDSRLYFGVPLFLGDPARSLAAANELLRRNKVSGLVEGLFLPEASGLRAEPGFGALVRELGLDIYWSRFGLPDVCKDVANERAFCSPLRK
jgi:tetratricopeptide (TPR) repeat protein